MALLFEKCEQASQTPDCPSSDSFDVDIQAFVHHQEQDGKPFFSDDPELDSLVCTLILIPYLCMHTCRGVIFFKTSSKRQAADKLFRNFNFKLFASKS